MLPTTPRSLRLLVPRRHARASGRVSRRAFSVDCRAECPCEEGTAGNGGIGVHVAGGLTCTLERDAAGGGRFRASGVLTLYLETAWRAGTLAGYVDTSTYLVGLGGAADGVTMHEGPGSENRPISRSPDAPEQFGLEVDARVSGGRHVFVVETVVEFQAGGRSACALVPVFRCSFTLPREEQS